MTDRITEVRCYIEEYDAPSGRPGLRLREKTTTRRVVLGEASPAQHQQFLQFLVAGSTHRDAMPALFDHTDTMDSVLVSGRVETTTAEIITFIHDASLSYLFV